MRQGAASEEAMGERVAIAEAADLKTAGDRVSGIRPVLARVNG